MLKKLQLKASSLISKEHNEENLSDKNDLSPPNKDGESNNNNSWLSSSNFLKWRSSTTSDSSQINMENETGIKHADAISWIDRFDNKLNETVDSVYRKVTSIFDLNRGGPGVKPGTIVFEAVNICASCNTGPVNTNHVGFLDKSIVHTHNYGLLKLQCDVDEIVGKTLVLSWTPSTKSHLTSPSDSMINLEYDSGILTDPTQTCMSSINDATFTSSELDADRSGTSSPCHESASHHSTPTIHTNGPVLQNNEEETNQQNHHLQDESEDTHAKDCLILSMEESERTSPLVIKECAPSENGSSNKTGDVFSSPDNISISSAMEFNVNEHTGVFHVNLSRLKSIHLFFERSEGNEESHSPSHTTASSVSSESIIKSEEQSPARGRASTWASPSHNPTYGIGVAGKRGSTGHMVLLSMEAQFKVFYFHEGGLETIDLLLDKWDGLFRPKIKKFVVGLDRYFMIYEVIRTRPIAEITKKHPDEGRYPMVTRDVWYNFLDNEGRVQDISLFKKSIFFGGLEPGLRQEVWPFLLKYYPYDSTYSEREALRTIKHDEYHEVTRRRAEMTHEEMQAFYRDVGCTVEKDVIRTDRSRQFYAGQDNANIDTLQEILLNMAAAHPEIGYTQGMSDLLAPVLEVMLDEADAYWCFEGLMRRTIFVSSPKQSDIETQLMYLRELYRLLLPKFYVYLESLDPHAMDLLFCHRWILLCFKREFTDQDALHLWEACWSHCDTDYFHLFLCVAIVALYGNHIVKNQLPADEMLLAFSALAHTMDVLSVLVKARSFVHLFRSLESIPCSLTAICRLCDSGKWDSGHSPRVYCTCRQEQPGYLTSPVRKPTDCPYAT